MVGSRLVLMFLLCFSWHSALRTQPFKCDSRPIISTITQNASRIYSISFGPFGAIGYNPVSFFAGEDFNGLGFNPKDNYIYAARSGTNSIVRLRADGSFETLGTVPFVNALEVYAGDCTPDGRYFCLDNTLDQVLVFRVVDGFELLARIDLFWNPASVNSGPFTTRLDDFAFDPDNPTVAYAYHGSSNLDVDYFPLTTRGYLLQINLDVNSPDLGMVTPVVPLNSSVNIARLGGLCFTGPGFLYGYGTSNNAYNAPDSRLFNIDPQSGEAYALGSGGPSAAASDACACPYSLSIGYSVNPLFVTCTGSEVSYSLTINNQSFEHLSDVTLTDTIAEGMLITGISGNFVGNLAPDTGVGTRFITINGLEIPPRGRIQMSISAQVIDVPVGRTGSQVYLRNLPSLFDGERVSDDFATSNTNDPAYFFADARLLEDVVLDITQPTDCLSNNDGQVVVSSPLFLPGLAYRIDMVNADWDAVVRQVVVDAENAFLLDSLPAGAYSLKQVTPANVLCSYEWKDTTIVIEAPNDQLQVEVQSNSPVCEGMALQVGAALNPGGSVLWTTPRFITNRLLNVWEAVDTTYSGLYEVTATYGGCEQTRTLDVAVAPAINAAIEGENAYCEREQMHLLATGMGDSLWYRWTGPNNLMDTARQIGAASVTPTDAGTYRLVVDNGACRDTVVLDITVLSSPTIEMPRNIEADFCTPVTLRPTITGDASVNFFWTPAEGLSCDDCPYPAVQLPGSYQLRVVNDTLCTDSATVRVYYRGDKLIYIPNAFSPNADGVNDRFQLFPTCVVTLIKSVDVYDRWGSLVFSAASILPNEVNSFWDGHINGKAAPEGVYLWTTEIELLDGTSRQLSGEVLLLR